MFFVINNLSAINYVKPAFPLTKSRKYELVLGYENQRNRYIDNFNRYLNEELLILIFNLMINNIN